MPDPTPPVDAQKTIDRGQYIRAWDNRIYLGEEMECATLPQKSGFRYVVMFDRNEQRWAGYLWKEDK